MSLLGILQKELKYRRPVVGESETLCPNDKTLELGF